MAVSLKSNQDLVQSTKNTKTITTLYSSSIEEPSILLTSNDVLDDANDILQKSLEVGGSIASSGTLNIGNSTSSTNILLANTYSGTPTKYIGIGKNALNNTTVLSSFSTTVEGAQFNINSPTTSIGGTSLTITSPSSIVTGSTVEVNPTTSITLDGPVLNVNTTDNNINSANLNVNSTVVNVGKYDSTSTIDIVNSRLSMVSIGQSDIQIKSPDPIKISSVGNTYVYGKDASTDFLGARAGLEISGTSATLVNRKAYSASDFITSSVACSDSGTDTVHIRAIENTSGTPSTSAYIKLHRDSTQDNTIEIGSTKSTVITAANKSNLFMDEQGTTTLRNYSNILLIGGNTSVADSGKRVYMTIGDVLSSFPGDLGAAGGFTGKGLTIKATDANNNVMFDAGILKSESQQVLPADGKFYSVYGFYSEDGISPFTGIHLYTPGPEEAITIGDCVYIDSSKLCYKSRAAMSRNVAGIAVKVSQGLIEVAAVGDTECGECKGFKVTNENGEILAGDLLVTSSTPGYLMKQSDDILRSCTVGKCMQDVSFDSDGRATDVYGYIYCG